LAGDERVGVILPPGIGGTVANVALILGSFYYMTLELHGGMVLSVLVLGMFVSDFFEFEARKVEARRDVPLEPPNSAIAASVLVLLYAGYQTLFFVIAPIWNAIVTEEFAALVRSEGVGHYGKGFYDTHFADFFAKARRTRANDYLSTVKLTLILGEYLAENYHGHYYAKAQNLRRELSNAYDEALGNVDVLAMPTTPQTAHERRDDLTRPEIVERALNMLANTAPFDVSGHPGLSVPCGTVDELPVGLMFVGERGADATVLGAGAAFEAHAAPEAE
jgi:hypothetical protein